MYLFLYGLWKKIVSEYLVSKSTPTYHDAGIISKGIAFKIIFHNKSNISSLKIEKFQGE